MKRATDTRDEGATDQTSKQIRTESRRSPTAQNRFADEFRVEASTLADTPLNSSNHIAGQIFMLWPVVKKTRKLQLNTETGSLDVVFEGPGLEKLDFLSKDRLKIVLEGARKEMKRASGTQSLPFKLVFSDGVIVLFLASEKRKEDKLVDLFKDAEEERRTAEDDWYNPPLEEGPVSEFIEVPQDHHIVPYEPDAHIIESESLYEHSDHLSDLNTDPRKNIQNTADDNNISLGPEDGPVAHYNHYIGTSRTEISFAVPPNPPNSVKQNVSSSTSYVLPRPEPQILPQPTSAQGPQHKEKRIKKRDTRQSRDSTGSVVSDIAHTNINNSGEPNTQKPLGKKARKKLAMLAARAKELNPPPPHDPALDLVPGFLSVQGVSYTPISDVRTGGNFSLVGVVVDAGAIKQTRTGEFSKSFVLVDPSEHAHGLTINIFVSHLDEDLLPSANRGQVLLLHNVKIKEFNGKVQGTCYKDSFRWCGYNPMEGKHFYTTVLTQHMRNRRLSNTDTKHDPFVKVSVAEMEYFVKISDWWRALKEAEEKERSSLAANITTYVVSRRLSGQRQKLRTVAELEHYIYADCVVELLKVFKGDINSNILVTDYSENKYLQHRVHADGYLSGRRTLQITLWDENHNMVEDLEIHGFYLLKNVKIKKTEAYQSYLEGSVGYEDRGIFKLGKQSTRENLPELLQRKQEYERNPHLSRFDSGDDDERNEGVPEPAQQTHAASKNEHTGAPENGLPTVLMKCSNMDQKRSTVEEVQRSGKCPNKFRIRVRIIEYYPRRIENFVIVECKHCQKILDDKYRLCPECGDLSEGSTTARYQFVLRVGDETKGEMNIIVSDEEADEVLMGLKTWDARDDVTALKTRLSPLLGHLDKWHETFEGATEAPGPWVDMCVNSWVPEVADVSETVRLYKLFGCRLLVGDM